MDRLEKHPQTHYLHPRTQSLYESELAEHPDDLWDFCWPSRSKKAAAGDPDWYIPVRWDGACRLCFVAAQPSSRGDFPSHRDNSFWKSVVEHGLAKFGSLSEGSLGHVQVYYEGPFVTNLVPRRSKVLESEDLRKWTSSAWVEGFLAKVRQADPILLVAMGKWVFEAVRQLPNLDVPIERVTHHGYFAWKATSETAAKTLNAELARVSKVYDRLHRLP